MGNVVSIEEYAKKRSRRIGALKKYGITALFLAPFIIAFLVFFVYPLFYGIYVSFTNYKFSKPGTEQFNNFQWYQIIFNSNYLGGKFKIFTESFWRAFGHSFLFSIIMVPIAIILPLTLAILVNMKPKGYKFFRALIYMPSIVPLTAAGTIFTLMFMSPSQHGLLYELFGISTKWFDDSIIRFSIGSFNVDVAYAWVPIFLMCLWGGWGSNFIIMSAGLQNVPKSLYEASSIDGCSRFKRIFAVTLPGIKPQIVLTLFTTIIGYLGLYGQNFVLSNGGPSIAKLSSTPAGGKTSTIIYFIQDIVANNTNFKERLYGLGAAASIVFALCVGIISGIQMYCTRDRKTGTKISEAYNLWQEIA